LSTCYHIISNVQLKSLSKGAGETECRKELRKDGKIKKDEKYEVD